MHIIVGFLIFIFAIDLTFCESNIECNEESSDKLDELIRKISTFGDPSGKFPVNDAEFAVDCQEDKKSLEWIDRYTNKCLKGLGLQITTLGYNDMLKVVKKYCDSEKLSKIFISWGRCGNSALNETVKCWDKYVLQVEQLNSEKKRIVDKDIVALTCCDYHQFDRCVDGAFHSVEAKECSTSVAEGLHSVLTEISGRILDFLCGDYTSDSDKCDSLLKRYNYLNDIKLNKPLGKSPVKAFIQIIENSPDMVQLRKDPILQ